MASKRWSFSLVFVLLILIKQLAYAQSTIDLITGDCLEVASQRECSIFIKCCDFKCQKQVGFSSRQHFCMALLGQIVTDKAECVCNSASSYKTSHPSSKFGIPKFDLVGGIFLIFVLDFILLTFTL
ncbi:hypothetical protein M3Y97_00057700 [Aphelenchoides bicaudatus]|nr:hypothetical protein M3Y97_00057700 [Aphelenchoides bicaudatus]